MLLYLVKLKVSWDFIKIHKDFVFRRASEMQHDSILLGKTGRIDYTSTYVRIEINHIMREVYMLIVHCS